MLARSDASPRAHNLAAATRVYDLIKRRLSRHRLALDAAQQKILVSTLSRRNPPIGADSCGEHRDACFTDRPDAGIPSKIRGGSMSRVRIPRLPPGLPSDLIKPRPDIREGEALLTSANANVYSARTTFFPSIQLTGEGGYQSAAFRDAAAAGIGVLQSRGRSDAADASTAAACRASSTSQKGRQDELLQLYRKAIINGFADVERALDRRAADRPARAPATRGGAQLAGQAFEIAETRLREGTVDLITVLNTQQTLFQAQDTLAQAQLRSPAVAVVGLFQALGGGWQKPKADRPAERLGRAS